jgi:NitT/TauT family transport system permease protein/sulfonate transport system permease protein
VATDRRAILLGIVGTGLFLGGWEALSRLEIVDSNLIPPPTRVARTVHDLFVSGEMPGHLYVSIRRALIGFLLGAGLGTIIGVATARWAFFRHLTEPLIQMFRAIPSIAFVPLAIFWFGLGEVSKIFLIAWGVFFPVWVNTFLGVRDVSPVILRAASTLGASGRQRLFYVVLPAALPFVLAGLRISLSVAFVLLVASEIVGAVQGVGYLIQLSQMVYRVDQMFVGLLFLGLLGFSADRLFVLVVQRLFPWYGAEERAARRL